MNIIEEMSEAIDKYVLSHQRPPYLQKNNYFSPSRITNCHRWQMFEKTMVKPKTDIALMRKGFVGELLHEHYILKAIQYIWPDAIELFCERDLTLLVDLEKQIFISGRCDGLVFLKNKKFGRFIVEIKTVANLFAAKEDIFDYKAQMMPYMAALAVDKAFLIVVSRSTGAHRVYLIRYDHEIFTWVVERVKTTYGYLERGELPPPEGLIDPRFQKVMARGKIKFWQCGYCPYSEECAAFEKNLRETDEK
jgi:hypothetical protein